MRETDKYAPPNIQKVLVSNKCDLKINAVVSIDEGKAMAEEFGIPFIETSAKESINIEEAFTLMTQQIIKIINQ